MTAVDTVVNQLKQERFSGTNEFIRCVNTDLQAALNELQTNSLGTKIASKTILSNITGALAVPVANTLSSIIDACIGGTRGNLLYRGASLWSVLAPSTAGALLQSGGVSGDPSWEGPGQVIGVATDSDAAAGNAGEYTYSQVGNPPGVGIASATYVPLTSIVLTAGDWDVWAYGSIGKGSAGAATSFTEMLAFPTTDPTGNPSGGGAYAEFIWPTGGAIPINADFVSLTCPPLRYSLASPANIYCSVRAVFTGGTATAGGRVRARRIR